MPTQIAEAYVQIKPVTKGIKNELQSQLGGEIGAAGDSAGESFGASMVSKLKGVIAAAGIGAVVKQALDAGGALQQSFGGLDTLYGDASQAAKDYAREAVQAGISMNDYAEQAVSFGASLKAAFGGDTAKAAEAANTAILDMADNAAKMGTPLESIQNAYQGFAKGNYTMLDNLKLGFSGSRTEMERLLETAEKSPNNVLGKSFDINNLGDVYEAIHIIQEDLGLTGVAAAEASETFTGSFAAMQAAATNLMADIATGNTDAVYDDIQTLFQTAETFILDNLAPMLTNIIGRVPQLIANFLSEIGNILKTEAENAPAIIDFAITFIEKLVNAIVEDVPYLIEGIIVLIAELVRALIEFDWMSAAQSMMRNFNASMADAAYNIFGEDASLLEILQNWVTNTLPTMLEKGIEIITNLVQGIAQSLPNVASNIATVMAKIIATIAANLPQILQKGIELIGKLIAGILQAIPTLVSSLPQVFTAIKNAFQNYDWKTLGRNILEGIKEGILNAVSMVVDAAKDAARAIFDAVKDFFEIGSPSKLMNEQIGRWIPAGVAVGIESNADEVNQAIEDMNTNAYEAALGSLNYSFDSFEVDNNNDNTQLSAVLGLLAEYLPALANSQIVLDSGVLVGATAQKMDVALGKLSTLNQRGVSYT